MGYTSSSHASSSHSAVHPHSRGVYRIWSLKLTGLFRFIPTRVGYTPSGCPSSTRFWRFIPTRVGYTSHVGAGTTGKRRFIPTRVGYTFQPRRPEPELSRFIPTRVGYTNNRDWRRCDKTVHPHSRGVYDTGGPDGRGKHGSSPLAWGIQLQRNRGRCHARFIPTRVGYTL